jgi:uncharacterized repeat protein (TIGR03806 family)
MRWEQMARLLILVFILGPAFSCGGQLSDEKGGKDQEKSQKIFSLLSEYELFPKLKEANLQPKAGAFSYDLNTALFSDYTIKDRAIFLPNGSQIQFHPEREFEMPVGTIISKTFSYPMDSSGIYDPDGKIVRLETRLMIHQPDGWFAVSYEWNKEQSDAQIVYAGNSRNLKYKDKEGKIEDFVYSIPSRNQCASCHQSYESRIRSIVPIGIKARHLNKKYSFAEEDIGQLEWMKENGKLAGLPWFGVKKNVDAFDLSESLDSRARSYLDINCAHCHQETAAGGINSKLILSYDESILSNMGLCKTPGSAGKGGGGLRYDIVPGNPEESILLYRMETQDPGAMMPQIGRALVHKEGVELIRNWIRKIEGKPCP